MTMTAPQPDIADILDRAADLIAAPGAWTQQAYARGKSGRPVVDPRAAVCYCTMGAINAAAGKVNPAEDAYRVQDAFAQLAGIGDDFDVPFWNDAPERTQDEVVSKLREAAAKARSEQGA